MSAKPTITIMTARHSIRDFFSGALTGTIIPVVVIAISLIYKDSTLWTGVAIALASLYALSWFCYQGWRAYQVGGKKMLPFPSGIAFSSLLGFLLGLKMILFP